MIASIQQGFLNWAAEISRLLREQVVDLDPQEYCIGAVFIIAIGYVSLRK